MYAKDMYEKRMYEKEMYDKEMYEKEVFIEKLSEIIIIESLMTFLLDKSKQQAL